MGMDLSQQILSDITIHMKYAKYLPHKNRRETWEELVSRNKNMHIKKFPELKDEIEDVYKLVYDKKILPSMRSMQFAGKPIEISPNRIFNCGYLPMDDWRAFSEIMFLLLGGCFHGETLIKTKDGDKQIQDLTCNDYIMTYNTETDEFSWIKPFMVLPTPSENKEKIELEMEDGTILKCTSDHKFFTVNRGWVMAKDLTEYDDIKNPNENLVIEDSNISSEDIIEEYKIILDFLLGN